MIHAMQQLQGWERMKSIMEYLHQLLADPFGVRWGDGLGHLVLIHPIDPEGRSPGSQLSGFASVSKRRGNTLQVLALRKKGENGPRELEQPMPTKVEAKLRTT